jgi:hypothetical protein
VNRCPAAGYIPLEEKSYPGLAVRQQFFNNTFKFVAADDPRPGLGPFGALQEGGHRQGSNFRIPRAVQRGVRLGRIGLWIFKQEKLYATAGFFFTDDSCRKHLGVVYHQQVIGSQVLYDIREPEILDRVLLTM